jgi:hypothetical protein
MRKSKLTIVSHIFMSLCGLALWGCAAPETKPGVAKTPDSPRVKAAGQSKPDSKAITATHVPADGLSLLTARAHEIWTARVDKDWATLYQYQSPAAREAKTEAQFVSMNAEGGLFRFDSYKIHEVQVDNDMGWVDVERVCHLSKFPDFPPETMRTWERWYRFNDQWYCSTPEDMDLLPTAPKERNAAEEKLLQKRFEELCELRVSSNFEKTYEFMPPATRERLSLQTYMEGEALMRVLSCDFRWAEVVGDMGRVRGEYLLQSGDPNMTKMPPSRKTVVEYWKKIDGTWYRISMVNRGCGK